MDAVRPALAVSLLVLGLGSVTARPRVELATDPVRVAMDHGTRHVAVKVLVNGRGPFLFHLDTGAAPEACIDESLISLLGLRKVGSVLNDDGTGRQAVQRGLFMLDELVVGGASFHGVEALAADYSWIHDPGEERVMGLLGFRMFADVLLTVDYPGNELRISTGSLDRAEAHVVPYSDSDGTPSVLVEIGGWQQEALIDTGDQATITFPEQCMETIRTRARPRVVGRARTVNNEFDILGAELSNPVRFGGHERRRVRARFAEFRQTLLGHDILDAFVLTFDQKKRLVRFAVP